jgi:hypothetical protein
MPPLSQSLPRHSRLHRRCLVYGWSSRCLARAGSCSSLAPPTPIRGSVSSHASSPRSGAPPHRPWLVPLRRRSATPLRVRPAALRPAASPSSARASADEAGRAPARAPRRLAVLSWRLRGGGRPRPCACTPPRSGPPPRRPRLAPSRRRPARAPARAPRRLAVLGSRLRGGGRSRPCACAPPPCRPQLAPPRRSRPLPCACAPSRRIWSRPSSGAPVPASRPWAARRRPRTASR